MESPAKLDQVTEEVAEAIEQLDQPITPREKSIMDESQKDLTMKADSMKNQNLNTFSEKEEKNVTAQPRSVKDEFANPALEDNNRFYDTQEEIAPIDPNMISEQDNTKPCLTR